MAKNIQPNSRKSEYPNKIDTPAKQALYDNLEKDEDLAIVMDGEIQYVKKDNWIGNTIKEREVKIAIAKHINDPAKVNEILEIVKNQKEYR